eukprot:COSAG01_NODE_7706_length_3091_cov_2.060495_4_plen_54_part_00
MEIDVLSATSILTGNTIIWGLRQAIHTSIVPLGTFEHPPRSSALPGQADSAES